MKRRFRFVAYLSPPPAKVGHGEFADNENFIDEKNYRTMTECGFDRAIGLFEIKVNHYVAGMKCARQVGMDYLVRDQFKRGSLEKIIDNLGRGGKTAEQLLADKGDDIARRFDRYSKYPAFSGILASDEPPASKFKDIRTVQDWFKSRYPDKEFLVNLLPTYGNAEQLSGVKGAETFDYEEDYVGAFIRTVDPEILSYDHYALMYDDKKGAYTLTEDYLRNLEVFAEYSRKTGKPFYNFLLTIGCLYYRTVKTYADIAWQVYTSMAYGVMGVQTFTYWTLLSNGPEEKITSALVDRSGTKMPAWYAMQRVISEVRAFEELYTDYAWVGTMPIRGAGAENINFQSLKHPLTSCAAVRSAYASEDCIAGVFEKEGKYALLLANFTDPCLQKSAEASLVLAADRVTLCRGGWRKELEPAEGRLDLKLESGEGVFIVLA